MTTNTEEWIDAENDQGKWRLRAYITIPDCNRKRLTV